MNKKDIITIDLEFQGKKQAISSYLIKHSTGVVLVESGPGSTVPALDRALTKLGYCFGDITHVLLTHIHLDHAGAAGELSNFGAEVLVHPVGAPHLLDPSKLIGSATRIYGDRMDSLWGRFLPVKPEKLRVLRDAEEFSIGDLSFRALFTPGHAEHHICYLLDETCFSGDIGGIRIPGYRYLRIPMPPPELHLQKWKTSIALLQKEKIKTLGPTHFGLYDDVEWHLATIQKNIMAIESWIENNLSREKDPDRLKGLFQLWMNEQASDQGLTPEVIEAFALSNPIAMSVDGMLRYWNKHLHPSI